MTKTKPITLLDFLYNSDINYRVSTANNCSGVERHINSNIIFVNRTDVYR